MIFREKRALIDLSSISFSNCFPLTLLRFSFFPDKTPTSRTRRCLSLTGPCVVPLWRVDGHRTPRFSLTPPHFPPNERNAVPIAGDAPKVRLRFLTSFCLVTMLCLYLLFWRRHGSFSTARLEPPVFDLEYLSVPNHNAAAAFSFFRRLAVGRWHFFRRDENRSFSQIV